MRSLKEKEVKLVSAGYSQDLQQRPKKRNSTLERTGVVGYIQALACAHIFFH
jgi:hypothetical protein